MKDVFFFFGTSTPHGDNGGLCVKVFIQVAQQVFRIQKAIRKTEK